MIPFTCIAAVADALGKSNPIAPCYKGRIKEPSWIRLLKNEKKMPEQSGFRLTRSKSCCIELGGVKDS